ncbi:SDR family oxidoreductase [Streptomyces sp. 1222.5]|uniref:SDR family oxidoreductase n=1 Tax=Streptomyces sp. 1222.5 TaxID=1881026 RepID=UPI003D74D590
MRWESVDGAIARRGRVVVLVNNAGVMPLSYMSDLRVDDWNQVIDVNLRGVLHGIAAVLPSMTERRSGHTIDVASTAAYRSAPRRRRALRHQVRRPRDHRRPAQGDTRPARSRPNPAGMTRCRARCAPHCATSALTPRPSPRPSATRSARPRTSTSARSSSRERLGLTRQPASQSTL